MSGFRPVSGPLRFLSVKLNVLNLFNWTRHNTSAEHNPFFRAQAFKARSAARYV
jgi:hypothetical protein